MKLNSISLLASLISLAFSVYLLVRINSLEERKNTGIQESETTSPVRSSEPENHSEEIEIVHYMQRLQHFHAKLYYSGVNENKQLLEFYSHEIKEEMEAIADADVFDEGINISENMKLWGIRNINSFSEQLNSPDFNFKNAFTNLTNACNSCHQATGHPYILITEPVIPNPYNQDFKSLK